MDESLCKIYTQNLHTNPKFLTDLSNLLKTYTQTPIKVYKQQTSFTIGEIGQQQIITLLQSVFGAQFVTDISKVSHQGDILINFMHKNIMVEVKNKQTITQTDIQKFKDDAQQYDFSIFISLLTTKLHEYNDFYYDQQSNHLYLSAPYISQQTFTLLKLLLTQKFISPNPEDVAATKQNMKIIRVFYSKLLQIQDITAQIQKKHIELSQLETQLQNISQSFSILLQTVDETNLILQSETELQNYTQTIKQSQLRKSYIVEQWPALQLQHLTLQQIITKYNLKFKEVQ